MSKLITVSLVLVLSGCVTFHPSQRAPYYKEHLDNRIMTQDNHNELNKVKRDVELLRDEFNIVLQNHNHNHASKCRLRHDPLTIQVDKL
jgi:hypothetical protein